MIDVAGISRGTTKQDELFDYADAPDYLKERVRIMKIINMKKTKMILK